MTWLDDLNEVGVAVDAFDVTPFVTWVAEHVPATLSEVDREVALRVVLQKMFTETVKDRPHEEKRAFAASVLDEMFSDTERQQIENDVSRGVRELPLPVGLHYVEGAEFLRVVQLVKNGVEGDVAVVVDGNAHSPEVWGLLLHDVAQHVAAAVAPEQRERVLETIVHHFNREHASPTDAPHPYKPVLDS